MCVEHFIHHFYIIVLHVCTKIATNWISFRYAWWVYRRRPTWILEFMESRLLRLISCQLQKCADCLIVGCRMHLVLDEPVTPQWHHKPTVCNCTRPVGRTAPFLFLYFSDCCWLYDIDLRVEQTALWWETNFSFQMNCSPFDLCTLERLSVSPYTTDVARNPLVKWWRDKINESAFSFAQTLFQMKAVIHIWKIVSCNPCSFWERQQRRL